jgi:hypothetical protein
MTMPPATPHTKPSDTTAAVERFMATTTHPCEDAIQALRELILAVHPGIREGIKWNAPSYRTTDYFATTNLRAKAGIGIILHLGAKVRAESVSIDDPQHLLTWHGSNRASLGFGGVDDIHVHATAVTAILAQWIAWV